MFRFEGLKIYDEANDLVDRLYGIVDDKLPSREKYVLSSQMIRAGISIPLNIAEGSSRSNKDFCRFLSISIGSIFEVVTCLKIACKRKYISEQEYASMYKLLESLAKRINTFKKSLC